MKLHMPDSSPGQALGPRGQGVVACHCGKGGAAVQQRVHMQAACSPRRPWRISQPKHGPHLSEHRTKPGVRVLALDKAFQE